jgi:hypothetical protein
MVNVLLEGGTWDQNRNLMVIANITAMVSKAWLVRQDGGAREAASHDHRTAARAMLLALLGFLEKKSLFPCYSVL